MKKIITFLYSIFMAIPVFAHSGITDRYLETMVSYRALLIIILVLHIILGICFKLRNNRLLKYNRIIRKAVRYIYRKNMLNILFSWILSSIVYGTYIGLLCSQMSILGIMLIPIFYLCFFELFLQRNLRKKFITGSRPIYYYIQSSVVIFFGMILYYKLCSYKWFRAIFSYTDEEYQLANFYLFPESEAIYSFIDQLVVFSSVLAFPYIIYMLTCFYKNMKSKRL